MKRITIFAFIAVFLWHFDNISAAETKMQVETSYSGAYPGVIILSDDLYVGKVEDDFYLAMERVDADNIKMWVEYAEYQMNKVDQLPPLKYLPDNLGSGNFWLVLKYYQMKKIIPNNELWVAYASDIPITNKVNLDVTKEGKNPHIEMFVSVVTSPQALISSHMGISRTWEAAVDLESKNAKRKKHPDQSIHLHSFAAKIIKIRDPKKVYMLTLPVTIMRNILINKMPSNTLFIGDNFYQEKLLSETNSDQEIKLLKNHPPRILRSRDKKSFTILNPDGSKLVEFNESTTVYQWLFTDPFGSFENPYVLIMLDALATVSSLIPVKE